MLNQITIDVTIADSRMCRPIAAAPPAARLGRGSKMASRPLLAPSRCMERRAVQCDLGTVGCRASPSEARDLFMVEDLRILQRAEGAHRP